MQDADFELITFDVYAALFDFRGSLTPVLARALGEKAPVAEILNSWRTAQLAIAGSSNVLSRGRIPFREATRLALDFALGSHGAACDVATRNALVAAWDELEPWPEVPGVLGSLQRRGTPLAILSNGDLDMLDALAARLPVRFAHIFSSQHAGKYKPHPDIYALASRETGLAPEQILHVAGSAMDVLGAKSFGMACAWSNRNSEPPLDPAFIPDVDAPDLRGVLSA